MPACFGLSSKSLSAHCAILVFFSLIRLNIISNYLGTSSQHITWVIKISVCSITSIHLSIHSNWKIIWINKHHPHLMTSFPTLIKEGMRQHWKEFSKNHPIKWTTHEITHYWGPELQSPSLTCSSKTSNMYK